MTYLKYDLNFELTNLTPYFQHWSGVHEAFTKEEPCRYVTGYDYRTALVLSVFLGMFGADRFYLG